MRKGKTRRIVKKRKRGHEYTKGKRARLENTTKDNTEIIGN